jgi:hypothetical protein
MDKCEIKDGKVRMCQAMVHMDDRVEFERQRPFIINHGVSLLTKTTRTDSDFVTKHLGIGTLWEDKAGMHMVAFVYCPFCGAKVKID